MENGIGQIKHIKHTQPHEIVNNLGKLLCFTVVNINFLMNRRKYAIYRISVIQANAP